jgi:Secretion system C-terminal sorting domain
LQFNASNALENNLQIRPNPFNQNTNFTFLLTENQKVRYTVFDSKGGLVHSDLLILDAGEQNIVFKGNNLESGLYFYRLITENQVFSGTLIKE